MIRRIADRHTGVGGDGVVWIAPPHGSGARARMRMFNADGSVSAMCGNALRCIALFVHRQTGAADFLLESDRGEHRARVLEYDAATESGRFEVDLGPPNFAAAQIPFLPAQALSSGDADGPLTNVVLGLPGPTESQVAAVVVSMGNPHCVLFVDDADNADFERLGPLLERHPAFPERANVEFVSVDPDGGLYQRTYERGTGETLSCGSGACAVHVAAVLTGRSAPIGHIRVRGGQLELEWQGSATRTAGVIMRGPARVAFQGSILV
jgi:diaminopimelate epimerase